jgi:small subunit ribosomal protein S9
MAKIYATGKRKTSIAKAWLSNGKGEMTINGVDLDTWLGGHEAIKKRLMQPLELSKKTDAVNLMVKVSGGGYSAQADAVRHAISRALVKYEEDLRAVLKPHGLMTRDARKVERKKYGRRKARRSPQFSKR